MWVWIATLVGLGVLVAVGAVAIERFAIRFVAFGAFLIWTAVKLVREYGKPQAVGANSAVLLLRRVMPVTDEYDARSRLTVRGEQQTACDAAVQPMDPMICCWARVRAEASA